MKNLYKPAISGLLKITSVFLLCFPFVGNAQESMRANLYITNSNTETLMDGNLTDYNNIYSNAVDMNDAWKMINPGINFGILREGYNLVVERRSIIGNKDTTLFKMWNMPQNHYRIKLILKKLDHPGLKCMLKDNYLHTDTQVGLNDTTNYDFVIDASTSSADQMRFQLIYGPSTPVNENVIFTGMQARRTDAGVTVDWSVTNEVSVASYTVETSSDGISFHNIENVIPGIGSVSKTYHYNDTRGTICESYYRIKVINSNGSLQYSAIAKVPPLVNGTSIHVYPNPVVNKTMQLQFNGQKTGLYHFLLINSGSVKQQLSSKQINSGESIQTLDLPKNLAPGIYKLIIVSPDKNRNTLTISVL